MSGLDSIKGYAEGEEVVAPTSSGLSMKVTPKGTLVPAAKDIVADPVVTADLLKNMQAMIDQKSSPFRGFQDSLARASAWTVPSQGGQKANAINQTIAAQNLEDKELFDMKQQMAAYKAAQSSSENDAARLASIIGGAGGFAGDTPSAGGQAIPADVRARMDAQKTSSAKLAVYDEYLKNRITEGTKKELSPAMAAVVKIYNPLTDKVEEMTQAQAEQVLNKKPELFRGVVQQPTQNTGAHTGGINVANIQQVESGGNPNAVSPKGAIGVMQTMPNTLKDPGFGVAPAKDNSPAELQRVGEDYFRAMQKQYGHDTLAAVAYNMGPSATDAWIKKGARFSDLPKETQDYIGKVNLANAMQSRQQVSQPTATGAGATQSSVAASGLRTPDGSKPTTRDEYDQAIALQKFAAEEKIKAGIPKEQEYRDNAAVGRESRETAVRRQELLSDPTLKKVIDKFQTGTAGDAFVMTLVNGIQAGNFGSINMADFMKTAIEYGLTDKDARNKYQELNNLISAAKVDYSKNIKGQGAVSDSERKLIAEAVGAPGTTASDVLYKIAKVDKNRAEHKIALNDARKAYLRAGGKMVDFEDSPEYEKVVQEYSKSLANILNVDPAKTAGIVPGKVSSNSATIANQDAAVAWAKENPKDPRAKKILKIAGAD